jgi:hypothetical protein
VEEEEEEDEDEDEEELLLSAALVDFFDTTFFTAWVGAAAAAAAEGRAGAPAAADVAFAAGAGAGADTGDGAGAGTAAALALPPIAAPLAGESPVTQAKFFNAEISVSLRAYCVLICSHNGSSLDRGKSEEKYKHTHQKDNTNRSNRVELTSVGLSSDYSMEHRQITFKGERFRRMILKLQLRTLSCHLSSPIK